MNHVTNINVSNIPLFVFPSDLQQHIIYISFIFFNREFRLYVNVSSCGSGYHSEKGI